MYCWVYTGLPSGPELVYATAPTCAYGSEVRVLCVIYLALSSHDLPGDLSVNVFPVQRRSTAISLFERHARVSRCIELDLVTDIHVRHVDENNTQDGIANPLSSPEGPASDIYQSLMPSRTIL